MFDPLWICKDGRAVKISTMSSSHIQNCINLIHRCNGWRREYLDRLELELFIRSQGWTTDRGDVG